VTPRTNDVGWGERSDAKQRRLEEFRWASLRSPQPTLPIGSEFRSAGHREMQQDHRTHRCPPSA